MIKFGVKIIYLVILMVLMAILLDEVYTYTHNNAAPRNEVDWLMNLNKNDGIDYAVLGSSRALHHIDVNRIFEKTGYKGVNLGVHESSVFEIKLTAKELIKRGITKRLFIQIDSIWNDTHPGTKSIVNWLPYIREKGIWENFSDVEIKEEFYYLNKIPFYRYCKYDSKIGFRQLFLALSDKPMRAIKNNGFIPLYEPYKGSDEIFVYQLKNKQNKHIKELLVLCEKENVELCFFTAPIYNLGSNNLLLKSFLPNYCDYSTVINNKELFIDRKHLNEKGAHIFTDIIIQDHFDDKY